ncbi:MAG: murein hydrolase activator EnvC family protein [Pseudomonadota bacterium]|jgi:septal ring factor EnvC (AmiA/AmiB activator)
MVNLFPRTAHVLVVLVLVGGFAASAEADDAAQKAKELKELQKALESARSELNSLSALRNNEERALRNLENQQAGAARALHEAREALLAQQADLEALRARQAALEGSIARGREGLAASVRALYALGPDSTLQGMLSPGGRADKMRMEGYLAVLRDRHARTLSGLRADLDESARVVAELESGLAHLIVLERSAREEQQRLDELRQKQSQAIETLEARMKAGEARVEQIRSDQRDLARLVRKLEEAARQPPPPPPPSAQPPSMRRQATDNGEAAAPRGEQAPVPVGVAGGIPVAGRLARKYGDPTGLGELRSDGHFYAAAEGTPVRAVADGRVVFADWMRGYGQLVILQHAGGYLSLYAHNEAIYKPVGASVRRGEVIGAAGRSGGARQTGLYFEVRHGGQPINPARWAAMKGG